MTMADMFLTNIPNLKFNNELISNRVHSKGPFLSSETKKSGLTAVRTELTDFQNLPASQHRSWSVFI